MYFDTDRRDELFSGLSDRLTVEEIRLKGYNVCISLQRKFMVGNNDYSRSSEGIDKKMSLKI
jgi:hypothetical protein